MTTAQLVTETDIPKADADRRVRHRRHANPLAIRGPIEVPVWQDVFVQKAPFALDIGFGEGMFLLELAQQNPQWNVLGLEIRKHLVENVLVAARRLPIHNVHAVYANANHHLSTLLPDESVAFVSINFPDPWYKTRHHKRRVVQPEWLDVLKCKLQTGAEIHAMTDYQPIALRMCKALQSQGFTNMCGSDGFAEQSTTGILTEREIKHTGRGEPIYRMRFVYNR